MIDIPQDITMLEWDYKPQKPEAISAENAFSKEDIVAAAHAINRSKKPFILAGGGVSAAGAER
ncbi:MAG: acetolactate synthase large subunit, partial [Christensenella sp.]